MRLCNTLETGHFSVLLGHSGRSKSSVNLHEPRLAVEPFLCAFILLVLGPDGCSSVILMVAIQPTLPSTDSYVLLIAWGRCFEYRYNSDMRRQQSSLPQCTPATRIRVHVCHAVHLDTRCLNFNCYGRRQRCSLDGVSPSLLFLFCSAVLCSSAVWLSLPC